MASRFGIPLAVTLAGWLAGCTAAELSSSAADRGDERASDTPGADPADPDDTASNLGADPDDDQSPTDSTPTADAAAEVADQRAEGAHEDTGVGPDTAPDTPEEPDTAVVDLPPTEDTAPDLGPVIPVECRREGDRDCRPGPGETACDLDVGPLFGGTVNQAIDAVIAAHPEWFDTTEYGMPTPGVVLGAGGDYVRAVAAEVTARGLCAIQDLNASAGNEMGVKLNNACAESYNILTSWGQVRRPPGAHIATCWPGWF